MNIIKFEDLPISDDIKYISYLFICYMYIVYKVPI